jgi:hypothetical protein
MDIDAMEFTASADTSLQVSTEWPGCRLQESEEAR